MKKQLKWILIVLVVAFGLLQLANPDRTNPPVFAAHDLFTLNPPPPQVAALLRTSCFDCHSNETKWPWYSHIAPMAFLVANDVKNGRERLNFSDWPVTDAGRARRNFGNISDEVDGGGMPLKKYTMIHHDAVLSADQRKAIVDWAEAQTELLKSK
jgi:hypothetical protein